MNGTNRSRWTPSRYRSSGSLSLIFLVLIVPIRCGDNSNVVWKQIGKQPLHHHGICNICHLKLVENRTLCAWQYYELFLEEDHCEHLGITPITKIDRISVVVDGVSCWFPAWRSESPHEPSWCRDIEYCWTEGPLDRSSHIPGHPKCKCP